MHSARRQIRLACDVSATFRIGVLRMPTFPSVQLERLQKLSPGDLRLLWVNDWYEGPLEAVVEHRGTRCLMVLHHQDVHSDNPYKWVLFELTPEQLAEEQKWHGLYVEHVGDHWCFHDGSVIAHPAPVQPRDPERFHALYKEREDLDLSANVALGWTDEMPKR
jgi:hypothetical protein